MPEQDTPPPRPYVVLSLPHFSRKQLIIGAAGAVCSIALALGGIYYVRMYTTAVGIPEDLISRTHFPLYYPKHPPAGFHIDSGSFNSSTNVVTYAYRYNGNHPLLISIQPLTSGIDTSAFRPTDKFSTYIGEAYLVDLDDRSTAGIVTDKVFVLINAPDKLDMDTLHQFVDSFRPAR
ncbi:MAG TPA: hypothetical protein VHQ86_02760 [Candidatus Saccharimonadia bacterium]|jgi:hypothetical protein|nr:hypothetical protein [Candidatus Saccharimonadia bacterium]